MTSQKYSVTLNRAHKIAARLTGLTQDAVRAMQTHAAPFTVDQNVRNVESKISERRSAFESMYAKFQRLASSTRVVREAIGKANSQSGVSDLLAEQVFVGVQLSAFKQVIECANHGSAINVEDVPVEIKADQYGRTSYVSVKTFTNERMDGLLGEFEDMQARAHGVADKIADANKYTVAFALDDDLAKAVGL